MKYKRFRRALTNDVVPEIKVVQELAPERARTKIFEYSRIAGAVAQVLMLFVVVFGYVYTVQPVFQHQLLEEKAARLSLDIEEKEQRLESALWELFTIDIDLKSLPKEIVRHGPGPPLSLPSLFPRGSIQMVRNLVARQTAVDPYVRLMEVISDMRDAQITSKTRQYPDHFFDLALNYLEENKEFLTCGIPDIVRLNERYDREIAALEPQIESELDKTIRDLTEDARANDTDLVLSDKFVAKTRSNIAIDLKAKVSETIWRDVESMKGDCAGREWKFFSDLGSLL